MVRSPRLKGAPGEGARLPSKPKLRALVLDDSVGEARATVSVPAESDAGLTSRAGAHDLGLSGPSRAGS